MIEPLHEAVLVHILDASAAGARISQRPLDIRGIPADPAHVPLVVIVGRGSQRSPDGRGHGALPVASRLLLLPHIRASCCDLHGCLHGEEARGGKPVSRAEPPTERKIGDQKLAKCKIDIIADILGPDKFDTYPCF